MGRIRFERLWVKKNKLLVISNGFPHIQSERYHCQFVYDMTAAVRDQFDEIAVISPQPYFPSWMTRIPSLSGLSKLSGFSNYRVGNISVYYPTYFTLPLPLWRESNYQRISRKISQTLPQIGFEPDVVHVHFLSPTGLTTIDSLPIDAPKIISMPGGDLYEWAELHPNLARATLRRFDLIQVPTPHMATLVSQLDPNLTAKIRIIPPSVDTNLFALGPQRKSASPKLLMVANLIEEKGYFDALELLSRLKKTHPSLHLDIIGTGPLQNRLEERIEKAGLGANVTMVGPVQHTKLPYWYKQADLLLFPSYAESFGIVQVEAMACGTPVLAYNNLGSQSILADYPQWMVKTGDIDGLTKKTKEILKNPPSAKVLRQIATRYSDAQIKPQLVRLYQELTHH